MSTDLADRPRVSRRFLLLFGLWAAAYLASGRLLDASAPATWRVALIVVPAACFVAWMVEVLRFVRAQDERERRIQFEGLAVSLPVTILLLMVLGQLEGAGWRPVPLRHLFVVPILVHAVAASAARRRLG